MNRMDITGAELAAMRRALGLSQTGLAEKVGIGRHAVSYWETKPKVDRYAWAVCQMAEVLPLPEKPVVRIPHTPWADRMAAMDREAEARFLAQVARIKARSEAWKAKQRVICGAKTRKGTPCRCKSEPGKRRCKFHGGMSTGAKTPEGKECIAEANRARWARWRAAKEAEACRNGPDFP